MKRYALAREEIRTGDVLLCKDLTFSGILIRVFTASGYNHVAVFVWLGGEQRDLWLAEMTGRGGYRLVRASDYLKTRPSYMRWGRTSISSNSIETVEKMTRIIIETKGTKYSYISLIAVWIAQLFGRRRHGSSLVCSTFVQKVWEAAGVKFDKSADPEDIERKCESLHHIVYQ